MAAITVLVCLLVGFLAGRLRGTLDERNRIAAMIAKMSREGGE